MLEASVCCGDCSAVQGSGLKTGFARAKKQKNNELAKAAAKAQISNFPLDSMKPYGYI